MKKRKKEQDTDAALPPEGLWISPDGRFIPVTEHLLALAHFPETFGLPHSTRHAEIPTLRQLALELIGAGWVRFRYLSGVYAFEVDKASRRLEIIEKVLVAAGAYGGEQITISQLVPQKEYEGLVEELFERTLFRYEENPQRNTWRFS